jgi:hypothetical protein
MIGRSVSKIEQPSLSFWARKMAHSQDPSHFPPSFHPSFQLASHRTINQSHSFISSFSNHNNPISTHPNHHYITMARTSGRSVPNPNQTPSGIRRSPLWFRAVQSINARASPAWHQPSHPLQSSAAANPLSRAGVLCPQNTISQTPLPLMSLLSVHAVTLNVLNSYEQTTES